MYRDVLHLCMYVYCDHYYFSVWVHICCVPTIRVCVWVTFLFYECGSSVMCKLSINLFSFLLQSTGKVVNRPPPPQQKLSSKRHTHFTSKKIIIRISPLFCCLSRKRKTIVEKNLLLLVFPFFPSSCFFHAINADSNRLSLSSLFKSTSIINTDRRTYGCMYSIINRVRQ